MARGIWKGSISFGLVEVPVVLHPATRSQDLSFAQLDKRDLSPIGYRRYNKSTGDEVAWADIVRGYEYEKGSYAVLSDADLEKADPKASHAIEILEFVDVESIDPVYFDTPYFAAPQHANSRAYALLREALRKSGKAGIGRVVLRTREHLVAVWPRGELLAVDLLRFSTEVRDAKEVEYPEQEAKALHLKDAEVEMASKLIEGMTEDWDPAKYHDRYREAVLDLVKKKVKSGKTTEIEEATPKRARKAAEVYDLMPLLQKSVASRGRTKAAGAVRERPRGAPKTTGPARAARRRTG
jgi:DNA end-binding protein Ku